MSIEQSELPIFLCYRQVDGSEAARWLHSHLKGKRFGEAGDSPVLDVYFDQRAPATGDWLAIHGSSLESARALLFICTPGAFARMEGNDWVHNELEWWISRRQTAPILIDVTGEGDRWIPSAIKAKWPHGQLVKVRLNEWDGSEREANAPHIASQIIDGIRLSESGVLFEELQEKKLLLQRSKRLIVATSLVGCLAIAGLVLALRVNAQLLDANDRLDSANKTMQQMTRAIQAANNTMLRVREGVAKLKRDSEHDRAETAAQLEDANRIAEVLQIQVLELQQRFQNAE